MDITARIALLREEMRRESIDAVVIPSNDPHNSEYVAPHWQSRKWISGFTGSAGTAVVTLHEAALWTDSRYFLQAASQLEGTEFVLMKDGIDGTPGITEWLKHKLSADGGTCVAVDGMLMMHSEVTEMEKELRTIGVTMRTNHDFMARIWKDRPAIPAGAIRPVMPQFIGETTAEKLARIRESLRKNACDALLLTDLMSIAWVTNHRGEDVAQTPVFLAFLYVGRERAVLFTNTAVNVDGMDTMAYTDFADFLKKHREERIMCDSHSTCFSLYNIIKERAKDMESPVMSMKAVKNAKEIEGFRRSMLRDGVAMVKWLRWLKSAVEAGGQSEISVSDKLEALRREAPEFLDLSFDTISGYMSNGAIVHYSATEESNTPLKPEGLLLVDSGAQYIDGTTDITRTIALGPVSEDMKTDYTLVLKANIRLALAQFPEGTNGSQLDAIARSVLWSHGMNYLHGTGHGVGWRLAVHEGPHAVRMDWRPAPLKAGMTITDEPGIYLCGRFGIRTENTMLVENTVKTEFGQFCRMTPLTLCPIDTTPVDFSMLSDDELLWLNNYHASVRQALLPLLYDDLDREWLIQATEHCGR